MILISLTKTGGLNVITRSACYSIFKANRWFGWNGSRPYGCLVAFHIGFSRSASHG